MSLFRNQKGDTIVEVLISITVVSAVLGSAYAVVNRTSKNAQQAREHSQALKVAESQLEVLKASSASSLPIEQFCFKESDKKPLKINTSANALTDPTVPASAASYEAECKYADADGSAATADRYWVAFTKNASDTYKIHVKWDGIIGSVDSVELAYKVY
jgi:type II secretory pathway pseudopilin PulG